MCECSFQCAVGITANLTKAQAQAIDFQITGMLLYSYQNHTMWRMLGLTIC